MAYFPFFTDIEGLDCLIVGGGTVALRKAEKLLPFGPVIHAVAPEFAPGFPSSERLLLRRGSFRPELLEGMSFVIAATDDRRLNAHISGLCRAARIPVNSVDDAAACTFIFPALVRRGELTVGISTGGASPSAAVYLKERIDALLPGSFGEILSFLACAREEVKRSIPTEGERSAALKELFALCMLREAPLSGAELREFIAERSGGRNE